ncbi:MAG: DUF934 domain-containing protein [Pseudomonadota bacterium]|nr:DUF934 domain-containing protein [Pseudomonadota bacterium]
MQSNSQANLFNVNGDVLADDYQRIGEDGVLPAGDVLLGVAQLDQLSQVTGKKGLLLTAVDSPEMLSLPLAELDLIAIEFAAFADGRGYSFATLLRRQGFKGELRAVGDVFKDVIFYLKRCGFDSFALKDGKDLEVAKAGLSDFSAGYQAATATPATHYQIGR